MRSSLRDDFLEALKQTNAPVFGLLSVIGMVIPYLLPPSTIKLEAALVVALIIFGCFACYLIFVLIIMLLEARRKAAFDQPRILMSFFHAEVVHLLLEPSDLFVLDGAVSLFQRDRQTGLELPVGVGRITNIQGDGKIQVAVDRPFDPADPIWTRLKNKDITAIQDLVVKAHVSAALLLEDKNR